MAREKEMTPPKSRSTRQSHATFEGVVLVPQKELTITSWTETSRCNNTAVASRGHQVFGWRRPVFEIRRATGRDKAAPEPAHPMQTCTAGGGGSGEGIRGVNVRASSCTLNHQCTQLLRIGNNPLPPPLRAGGGGGSGGSCTPKIQNFVHQKQPNQYFLL